MSSNTNPPQTAVRLYSALLSLYPQAHRQAFGTQMLQTFRDHYADVAERDGQVGLRFWLDVVRDQVISIPREQIASLQGSITNMSKLIFATTIVLAAIVGAIVLTTRGDSDVTLAVFFAVCLFSLVGLGGYVLWRAGSAAFPDPAENEVMFSARSGPLRGLSAAQSRRLSVACSTILWVFPLAFLGYIWVLSNLDDLFGPVTPAQASGPYQTFTNFSNLLMTLSGYVLLAAALILGWSIARRAGKDNWQFLYWAPLLLAGIALCFAPFVLVCDISTKFYLNQSVCGSLPFGGEQFFPMLFVSLLVLAVAVAQRPVGEHTLRFVFVPLAFVTVSLVVQVLHLAVWAATIWSVPQNVADSLAFSTDRVLWSVGDWHIQLVLGLGIIFVLVLAALRATFRGVSIWAWNK